MTNPSARTSTATSTSLIQRCRCFLYLRLLLDGYWELRESMKEADVEVVVQWASDLFPGVREGLITDNGPQFVARDFCNIVRLCGMTHVRTLPYYPQSNGKLKRLNY